MAFAEQMALRSVSFEVTAWTRADCFLIPRCIALHLWSGLFTKFVVLFPHDQSLDHMASDVLIFN